MQKYIIYGKSNCPYCIKLVTKLAKAKKCFHIEMLDDHPDRLERLKKQYNHPTVPIVLKITETLIGGCDDTLKLIATETANE
jgi:glutaredoxin